MKSTLAAAVATVCAGLAFGFSGEAAAQDATEDELWITVVAPRLERESVGRTVTGRSEIVAITHRVSYAGLDLTKQADVKELEQWVGESAQTACEQLAVLYPVADLDTRACVREAVRDATVQVEQAVAAAQRH
jgi:UrcA family protein